MPKETSLVPSQGGDVYSIMDQLDDQLIKAEIENRVVDTWVYSFQSDGRPQTGLSKVGVDACCTEMAKTGHVIREGNLEMTIDPTNSDFVLFTCIASRFMVSSEDGREICLETVNGAKRQYTKMRLRNGSTVEDPHWFEKGSMKAARNGRARLIPEEVKAKIILLAKQKGRVQTVEAAAPAPAAQQAATTAQAPSDGADVRKVTPKQVNRLWVIARIAVENDEDKARAAVKRLLDFVGVAATGDLTRVDYDRVCKVLETGEIPKEWEGKLEWGDAPKPKPQEAPKDEAPF